MKKKKLMMAENGIAERLEQKLVEKYKCYKYSKEQLVGIRTGTIKEESCYTEEFFRKALIDYYNETITLAEVYFGVDHWGFSDYTDGELIEYLEKKAR